MRRDDEPSKENRWQPADDTKDTRDKDRDLAASLQQYGNGWQANRQNSERKVVSGWFHKVHHGGRLL